VLFPKDHALSLSISISHQMIRLQWQTLVGSQPRSSSSEELLGSEDAPRKHVFYIDSSRL